MQPQPLLICGSIAVDRLMSFSGKYQELIQPDKLDVLSLSILLDSMSVSQGGIGPNIAWSAAQLGNRPTLLGSAGPDSHDYLQRLTASGIETSGVHISELPTATFTAFTDDDNNQVGGFYPGAMTDSDSLTLAPWANQAALLCLSANDPTAMRRLTNECGQYDVILFYDPGQQVNNLSAEDLLAGIKAATILAVNEYELAILCQKTGLSELQLIAQVPTVIITKGEIGSTITGNGVSVDITIKSAKPSRVIDPTGAGDAYRAGFLHGYLRKWELKACGQLGATLASFVLEQPGTQVTLSIDHIKQRYAQTYHEEINL